MVEAYAELEGDAFSQLVQMAVQQDPSLAPAPQQNEHATGHKGGVLTTVAQKWDLPPVGRMPDGKHALSAQDCDPVSTCRCCAGQASMASAACTPGRAIRVSAQLTARPQAQHSV